jgi:hypothetical protein
MKMGDRKMVDLEAAELTAARQRNEDIARKMKQSPQPPAPTSMMNVSKNVVANSTTKKNSRPQQKYDTTPKCPPGLGGEQWETWRHLPTVTTPKSGAAAAAAAAGDVKRGNPPLPAPPSPFPVVVAPTMSVSPSPKSSSPKSSPFSPSKVFSSPSSAASSADALTAPPTPPPIPPKLGRVMARTYEVDLTRAGRKRAKQGRGGLFGWGGATEESAKGAKGAQVAKVQGDDAPRVPASTTTKPAAAAAADAGEDEMAALAAARAAASATDVTKAATTTTTTKKKTKKEAERERKSAAAAAAAAAAATAELMARTLQSMPVEVVQESAHVMTDPVTVIGITAVERRLDPQTAPMKPAVKDAASAKDPVVVPAKPPPPTPPPLPPPPPPPHSRASTGVTFVEEKIASPSPAPLPPAPAPAPASGVTFVWSGSVERNADGAPGIAERNLASTERAPPVVTPPSPKKNMRGDIDIAGSSSSSSGSSGSSGSRGKRAGDHAMVARAGGAVGRGCRNVAGAFGSGVMALGRVTGKGAGAVGLYKLNLVATHSSKAAGFNP